MSQEIRFKPLSSGIGLGQLKAAKKQKQPEVKPISIEASLPPVMQASSVFEPKIDLGNYAIHQAKQAYEPHSVGTQLKAKSSSNVFLWLVKGTVGWMLDLAMVFMTLIVCSVLGAMAWRLGANADQSLDPVSAIGLIASLLKDYGLKVLAAGFLTALLLYWVSMKFFVGATVGSFFRSTK